MNEFFKSLIQKFSPGYLTDREVKVGISETREISTPDSREIISKKPAADSLACPYCGSAKFVRRGLRAKKHEKVQLYLCKSCGKTFTPQITKGKHYPLAVMLDALSVYNLGYSLEETCRIVNRRVAAKKSAFADLVRLTDLRKDWTDNLVHRLSFASASVNTQAEPTPELVSHVSLKPSTLSNWLTEFKDNLPYLRLREFALKRYLPKDMVATATLAHRQLYRYRFHRAKCDLMIQEDIQHRKFRPMQDFLDLVPSETPHQYFNQGERASETPLTFSKTAMIVRGKTNFATKTAAFVLQSVKDRKLRHEALQKFMLYNDSVTVATEVPVYITKDDIEHMKSQLGFEIFQKTQKTPKTGDSEISDNQKVGNSGAPILQSSDSSDSPSFPSVPKLITGHIDILQIRNGMVHILDYKPRAEKERPIEQLTLYAMALSRLTGLRLFEFKCAWFDEKDYFEFYPLHVLHKPRRAQRRRKVNTQEGTYLVNRNERKIEQVRPI